MSITPNLDKFPQGIAECICIYNRPQMAAQQTNAPNMEPSLFSNAHSKQFRSYGLEINDIVFGIKPAVPHGGVHIGRNARYANAIPTHPNIQSSLTGLQSIPGGGAAKGIAEMMKDSGIDEDMMRLCLLARLQIVGISKLDADNEMKSRQNSSNITVQISGIVSMHAHQKMWTGGLVRADVPSSTEFKNAQWNRGRGRALGKISLVPVMVTPRDVTQYSQTIMHNFIYNAGVNALRMLRKTAAHNLLANYAEAQKEHAVTCGILFNYCMAERGFVGPIQRVQPLAGSYPEGRSIGLASNNTGERIFGKDNFGNHGRIFFKTAPDGDGYTDVPTVTHPAEVAVFHGKMTGLLQDRDEGGTLVESGNVPFTRAIEHAAYVARSPAYEADRIAYDAAMDRFFKMIFAQSGEIARSQGSRVQRTEEFGMHLFARGQPHIARENVTVNGVADVDTPKDNLYGRMLRQQYQSFALTVSATEDLYNFNLSTLLGRVTQGCSKDNKFHFYYSL